MKPIPVYEGRVMFTTYDAAAALAAVDIDISNERYGLEDLRAGMNVELEHGTKFPDLDVTGDDPVVTLKIALAHLREFPDYYDRLEVMEREADTAWEGEREFRIGICSPHTGNPPPPELVPTGTPRAAKARGVLQVRLAGV